LRRLVDAVKSLGLSVRVCGVASIMRITDEWSELRSRVLLIEQYKLLGIFVTKMSRISGFFLIDVGQCVGPGGASILYFFELMKL